MAITDKEQGVWDVDQVYNKINQGGIWEYTGAPGEPGGLWQTRSNWYGRLGDGTTGMPSGTPAPLAYYSSPVMAPGTYTTAWAGIITIKARGNDGTLWSWGYNTAGQLGLNDTASRSRPVQVGTDTDWTDVYDSHGRKSDGTIWAIGGWNTYGQLGLNEYNIHQSSPTQVGTDTTWTNEVNSNNLVSWIKTDGTLWVWGYSQYGELGLSQSGNQWRSSPTQIPSPTTFAKMAITGPTINGGITTPGTLYMWGNNRYGQLGLNQGPSRYPWQPWFTQNHHDKSAPNAVPGNWAYVQAYQNTTLATKTDGTLWYWGYGGAWNGAGPTAPTHKSSPTQVGTDTTWTGKIWHNGDSSAAVKTDGTVWSWGSNPSGSLGHNDTTTYSSPKQIPGTNWTSLEYSTRSIALIKPG